MEGKREAGRTGAWGHARGAACAHGRLIRGAHGLQALLAVVLPLLLSGCFLTDHGEREVRTDDVHFPVSGYDRPDAKQQPAITFDATEVDMGAIVQGAVVTQRFTFRSTGGSPLVLSAVNSTCGCTVGKDWPKHPIPPGGTGHIDVSFDSEGRSGRQVKTITVVSNAHPPSTVLTLTGEVIGPDTRTQP